MSCSNIEITGVEDLGCFSHCGEIELPLIACQTGIHTFHYSNKGAKFSNEVFAIEGETFKVNNHFNECAPVEFYIIQPDEVQFCTKENDRFCFRINIKTHIVNEVKSFCK